MASQKGLHKILDTNGDATYSNTQDGYRVKKIRAQYGKFATTDSMIRTRENAAEFGRAGKAGRLFQLELQRRTG